MPVRAQVRQKQRAVCVLCLLVRERGGGGRWHDAWLCCCLQRAAPIGLSPLAAALPWTPLPPEAAAPICLSTPSPPAWPNPTSLPTRPFPWDGVPTEPPDCPCLTSLCRVHAEEGNGPRCWAVFMRLGGEGALECGAQWSWGHGLHGTRCSGGTAALGLVAELGDLWSPHGLRGFKGH